MNISWLVVWVTVTVVVRAEWEELREVRGELEQLRREVRRDKEDSREEENRKVVLDWVRQSVQDLREEVRNLEIAAENNGRGRIDSLERRGQQMKDRLDTMERRLDQMAAPREEVLKVEIPRHLSKKFLLSWIKKVESREAALVNRVLLLEKKLESRAQGSL